MQNNGGWEMAISSSPAEYPTRGREKEHQRTHQKERQMEEEWNRKGRRKRVKMEGYLHLLITKNQDGNILLSMNPLPKMNIPFIYSKNKAKKKMLWKQKQNNKM